MGSVSCLFDKDHDVNIGVTVKILTFFNEMVITLFRLLALLVAFITPPRNFEPKELKEFGCACCPSDSDEEPYVV
jgi:hypothetical protein